MKRQIIKQWVIIAVIMGVFSLSVFGQETTPEPTPEATPEISAELADIITIEFVEGEGIAPPIDIDLPEDWVSFDTMQIVKDVNGELRLLMYTVYLGPVTDGLGFVVLIWGFDNIGLTPTDISLYVDGLRLFHLAIVEPGCAVSTDVEREFPIGDFTGQGTYFTIRDCPETLDTRGWFASLQQDNVNFAFYLYAEPIGAMDGAAGGELRAILDSVEFRVPEWIEEQKLAKQAAEATPEVTPEIDN